jgi:hypothetical protein
MKAATGLILYKRHNAACNVRKTRLSAKAKRFWMEGDCQIWIVGRLLSGIVPRQATGCKDVKQAEVVRTALTNQHAERAKGDSAQGPTIAEYAEKYIEPRCSGCGL